MHKSASYLGVFVIKQNLILRNMFLVGMTEKSGS